MQERLPNVTQIFLELTDKRVVENREVFANEEGEERLAKDPVESDDRQDEQGHEQVHHRQVDEERRARVVQPPRVVDNKHRKRVHDRT